MFLPVFALASFYSCGNVAQGGRIFRQDLSTICVTITRGLQSLQINRDKYLAWVEDTSIIQQAAGARKTLCNVLVVPTNVLCPVCVVG